MSADRRALTAAEFEEEYAARSGTDPGWFRARGRWPERCRCGDERCRGWVMGYQWEDAITENEMRGAAR